MSSITLITPPVNTIMTTLTQVKAAMDITVATYDTQLTRFLYAASEEVQNYIGRPVWRAKFAESFSGNDRSRRSLGRYPIATIDDVLEDGTSIGTDDITIENRDGGIIYKGTSGWYTKTGSDWHTGTGWYSGNVNKWTVQYTAGYFLPSDDLSTSVDAASADNSFNSSAAFPELLRAGDVFYASGFTNSANNGRHVVSSATTSKIVVTSESTLVLENSASRTMTFRTAPMVFENATIELVRNMMKSNQGDPDVANWREHRNEALAPLAMYKHVVM